MTHQFYLLATLTELDINKQLVYNYLIQGVHNYTMNNRTFDNIISNLEYHIKNFAEIDESNKLKNPNLREIGLTNEIIISNRFKTILEYVKQYREELSKSFDLD